MLDDELLLTLQLRLEMRRQGEARLGAVEDEGGLAGVSGDVLETLGEDGHDSLLRILHVLSPLQLLSSCNTTRF